MERWLKHRMNGELISVLDRSLACDEIGLSEIFEMMLKGLDGDESCDERWPATAQGNGSPMVTRREELLGVVEW